jgi:multidrug resistance protein
MARHLDEESPLLERDSEDEERSHHHLDFDQDDERNPRAWPRYKKLCNVAIIACMSILSPLASSIFTPGIHQIADGLHTTPDRIIATTTGFVIMLGLGPLVLAPLSETFGRRIVYVSCFSVFTLLHIPAALSPNVAFLIAIRTISGFFGSVGIANGGGTINDMFEPSGRANVYGWYLLGPMLGPVLGPLLGGFIVERLGWWWIYWVLTFICSCNTLAGYLFLKESYAPILLAQQKKKLEQECGSHATYSYEGQDQRPLSHKVLTSFRRPVVIFYQPIVLILSTFQALVFSTTYTVYTQMQAIFASGPYCFSTEQVGYLYLSIGLGSLTSVWFLVPQIDNVYNKLADRNKGVALPEYRLPLTNIGSVLVPLSLIRMDRLLSITLVHPNFGTLFLRCGPSHDHQHGAKLFHRLVFEVRSFRNRCWIGNAQRIRRANSSSGVSEVSAHWLRMGNKCVCYGSCAHRPRPSDSLLLWGKIARNVSRIVLTRHTKVVAWRRRFTYMDRMAEENSIRCMKVVQGRFLTISSTWIFPA